MFGIVWAFNGLEPLFDLAAPSRPFERLTSLVADPFQVTADPWVICCNTPDWVHFATVHRFDFPREGQNETLRFEPFGVRRQFSARLEHGAGPEISFSVTVRGTTLVLIEGLTEGKWFAVAACLGVPRPGLCDFFVVTMVDRGRPPRRRGQCCCELRGRRGAHGRRGRADLERHALQARRADAVGPGSVPLPERLASRVPILHRFHQLEAQCPSTSRQRVVVTGASRGIAAIACARLTGRRWPSSRSGRRFATAAELGREQVGRDGDPLRRHRSSALEDRAARARGHRCSSPTPARATSPASTRKARRSTIFERIHRVNLIGAFNTVRAAACLRVARIVFTTSVHGQAMRRRR